MGKSGQALKQVLGNYNISQNKLATVMGIRRSVIYRWVHELADPTGDNIAAIASALQKINPDAAKTFVRLYLGEYLDDNPPQMRNEEE